MIILEILERLGVIIASITAFLGINAWRSEAKWKRKYELSEEVLSLFYEVRVNMKLIRSPFAFSNEGSSRKKGVSETAQETEEYNKAYVYIERYERVKEPFIKLETMKYRFMAVFGRQTVSAFNEIQDCLRTVLATYDLLCRHYWEKHRDPFLLKEPSGNVAEKVGSFESIIWYNTHDDDEIDKRIVEATKMIEDIVSNIMKK